MSDAVKVAWIEFVPKVIWPLVAAFAIVLFHDPISKAINNAVNGGATVEFAGLKVTLLKSAVPPPPDRIKDILPKINGGIIEYIMANTGGGNTPEICYQDPELREFQKGSVTQTLVKLGLITVEREPLTDQQSGKPCLAGGKTRFTELYDATRAYLTDILKSVIFSH